MSRPRRSGSATSQGKLSFSTVSPSKIINMMLYGLCVCVCVCVCVCM